MKINVTNNVPHIKVNVNESCDGFTILLEEEAKDKKQLGNVKPGEIVKIGGREYIVLSHEWGATAVITKEFITSMRFGDSNNYQTSDVRKYCNEEFYKELSEAIGADNILEHTINLTADDGTNKGIFCKDNISIITAELYRRYREYLPAYGDWWWTATPLNTTTEDYSRCVCFVSYSGILGWRDCGYCYGVRPLCVLDSSILVS